MLILPGAPDAIQNLSLPTLPFGDGGLREKGVQAGGNLAVPAGSLGFSHDRDEELIAGLVACSGGLLEEVQ